MIGSQQQILDADWLLYCALALLAGHSETNVSHSDTPAKLTVLLPPPAQLVPPYQELINKQASNQT